MKRLAVAVACALLLHAGLFWIGSGWFISRSVPPSATRFVTVTMSYRQAPVQAELINKETVKPPDKPKAHANLPEKTARLRAVQPEENNASSRAQPEKVTDGGEAIAFDDAHGSGVSPKESGGSATSERKAVPLYKVNPLPRYPAAARRRGAQGTAVLSVHVDEHGRVSNLWLFESSGHRALDTAALQAVKDWIFEPGMQGGSTVAMWVNVPVRFELK